MNPTNPIPVASTALPARTSPFVVAVTATFRRPAEIAALLASLATIPRYLGGVVLVDNSGDPATEAAAEKSPLSVEYFYPGGNLGCGGGLNAGEKRALERFGDRLTHVWILDDDCVVGPESLEILLQEIERAGAEAAHPMSVDAQGLLSWAPGLLDPVRARAVRHALPPGDYLARFGDASTPFSWSQGIALLITRRVLDELGFHRTDYWVRGEDLELTLRITHRWAGIYVPKARVEHLPPAGSARPEVEYVRHAAMLQNIAYTSLRLRHGWRVAWTLPSNWLRFWRSSRFSAAALGEICRTIYYGALLGWPAGKTYGRSAPK